MHPFRLLLERRARSFRNTLVRLGRWGWVKQTLFISMGLWMLYGVYAGFLRVNSYLMSVPAIGPLLIWKLTGITLITTFSMVAMSAMIVSLTGFFYSFDLIFLVRAPLSSAAVFIDKSLESAFLASWMIALVLMPYVFALGRAGHFGPAFYGLFALLLVPFLLLACVIGMAFSLVLMSVFPSPRTRDAVWLLSSLSIAVVYVLLRLAQPEKLARPDALQLVANYLDYLQAPTAPYLPSWWMTKALAAGAAGNWGAVWPQWLLLTAAALMAYAGLVAFARGAYFDAFSAAQEASRYRARQKATAAVLSPILWKDRRTFFRDVKHWSQIVLIVALMCVYLFSIRRLPLDSVELKSLISFLNLGLAGFVIASLGLRFTFPAISMEGKAFWVSRAAPMTTGSLMRQKFVFYWLPTLVSATILVGLSNRYLNADPFITRLSFATIVIMATALCAMGIGFSAAFPKFNVENIHQLESSSGAFVYMCSSMAYIGATIALEAWPVQLHFQNKLGLSGGSAGVSLCLAGLVILNLVACVAPWRFGLWRLETYESD